jgi:hypothetical protein
MSEAEPLICDTIQTVAGIVAEPERPPRAGDYSFNGIGISSFFMLSSTMSEADRAARGYYPVGGCGGNIAWHTEDDTLGIADRDNLLRDMRVYGATLLRVLNAPVHPFDWRVTTAEFAETLSRYQVGAGEAFDFTPSRRALDELNAVLEELYGLAGAPELEEDRLRAINQAQRRIGRFLIPVNFSRVAPFRHDPALNVPPLPDLTPALKIDRHIGDTEGLMLLKTHLQRGQNRLVWALTLAREAAERALRA